MKSPDTKALLIIIGVNFLWGIDFIAIEYMTRLIPPALFTLLRLAIGAMLLLAACFIKRGGLHIEKKDTLRIFIAGGIGMALYFTVESFGTSLTSASFSSLIMATVPIFGMIGDRLVYGSKITALKVGCALVSILGVYLLVLGEPLGINPLGLAAMFAAAVLWAFYIVYTKTLFDKYDLLTLLTGLFVSGVIVQVPLTLVSQGIAHAPVTFTAAGILITVATAIVCIIIGEFGYVYAIGKLSITMVSIFENVLPLTAVLFSLILFGTMLSGVQLAGGIIIMGAVTVMALKDKS
jgi:drug/metabolite transporter (DMT)-like permease